MVCVDAAPISVSGPVNEKKERKTKKARSLLSPFRNQIVDIKPALNANEKKETNFLYSHWKDKFDIVYESASSLKVIRFCMEMINTNSDIHHSVMDVWAEVLNHEESFRMHHPGAGFLEILNIWLMYYDIMLNETEDRMYEKFNVAIEKGLAFYGMSSGLIDVDLITVAWKLKHWMRNIMECLNWWWNPNDAAIVNVRIERWPMHCRTSSNFHDCGVFTMRNLETYKGQPASSYNCGLYPENQNQISQLQKLRSRYASKILLTDNNILRDIFISDVLDYATTRSEKDQAVDILEAIMNRNERWDRG